MTQQTSSSCASANTFTNDLGSADIDFNKQISVNGVAAVRNPLCKFTDEDYLTVFMAVSILYLAFFKIGKVNEIKLFTKSEHIVEHDVLLNFSNSGSKIMFELPNNKQSALIDRVLKLPRLLLIDDR